MNVKGKVKTLSIVVIWILVAGCSGDKEGTPGFFSGGAQSVDKRQIRDMPPARDSVSMLDLDVFEFEDFLSTEMTSISLVTRVPTEKSSPSIRRR